jgi:hypothetical protein
MRQGILRLSHMASDNDFNLSDGVLESVQGHSAAGTHGAREAQVRTFGG